MKYTRTKTRPVYLKDLQIGGQNHVVIQTMSNIKTSRISDVLSQIERVKVLGAELMRLSVLDEEDAEAFKILSKESSLPLVADIHFSSSLALKTLENGANAIRINPGNLQEEAALKEIIKLAKKKSVAIRIGVNGGSLPKHEKPTPESLFDATKKAVAFFENEGFTNIVLSLKGSDVRTTIKAYELAADYFPYPLHLGITEAGPSEISLIRSSAGLAPLLIEGLGDTIRISMSEEPEEEVKAASRLLHDLGLLENYPTFISCPTCGRTEVDLLPLAKRIQKYLEEKRYPLVVAVMGCVVNGPGEAKHADIGIAGGRQSFVLFKEGNIIKTIKEEEAEKILIAEIEDLAKKRHLS